MRIFYNIGIVVLSTVSLLFCAEPKKRHWCVLSYVFDIRDNSDEKNPLRLNLLSAELPGASDKEKIAHAQKVLTEFIVEKELLFSAAVGVYTLGGGCKSSFVSLRSDDNLLPGLEHREENQKRIDNRIGAMLNNVQSFEQTFYCVPQSPQAASAAGAAQSD